MSDRWDRFGYFIGGGLFAFAITYWATHFSQTAKSGIDKAESAKPEVAATKPVLSFDELLSNRSWPTVRIDPTGDGSAYVYVDSRDDVGLWFMRGAEVVRVREVSQFTESAKPFITPSLLPTIRHDMKELAKQLNALDETVSRLDEKLDGGR